MENEPHMPPSTAQDSERNANAYGPPAPSPSSPSQDVLLETMYDPFSRRTMAEEIASRREALARWTDDEVESIRRLGAGWRKRREQLGFSLEDAAMLVHPDTTPEDLALIELGLPPPDGIPRPLAEHLDRYLGMKRLGPDGIIIPE